MERSNPSTTLRLDRTYQTDPKHWHFFVPQGVWYFPRYWNTIQQNLFDRDQNRCFLCWKEHNTPILLLLGVEIHLHCGSSWYQCIQAENHIRWKKRCKTQLLRSMRSCVQDVWDAGELVEGSPSHLGTALVLQGFLRPKNLLGYGFHNTGIHWRTRWDLLESYP